MSTPHSSLLPDASPSSRPFLVACGVVAVLLVALVLRLYGLDAKTMRQDETYVPGLALPAAVSDPAPRHTVLATLTGTMWDVHPPTWYVGMLFWTKAAGTSLVSLRLPAVIFGVLVVLLTFALARSETEPLTALGAAALVAVNGHQVLWSQIARQYTYVACVGLAATLALERLTRDDEQDSRWLWMYCAATLLGLYSLYYFWLLFMAHVVWTALFADLADAARARLLKFQLLLLGLAGPVISIAVFQSKESYLQSALAPFVVDYLRFGFLFEPDAQAHNPLGPVGGGLFALGALGLLVAGVLRLSRARGARAPEGPSAGLPPFLAVAAVAVVTALAMVGEAWLFRQYKVERTAALLTVAVLPLLAMGGWSLITPGLCGLLRRVAQTPMAKAGARVSLVVACALVSVGLVAALNVATPFLASKGMVLITPYLLIVLAAGVRALAGASRMRLGVAALVVVLLGVVHAQSLAFQAVRTGPQDYAGMARQWGERLANGDVVFASRDWATTGVFYYLDSRPYRLVGGQYARAVQRGAPRVWLLCRRGLPAMPQMHAALAGYRHTETYRADGLWVELWETP